MTCALECGELLDRGTSEIGSGAAGSSSLALHPFPSSVGVASSSASSLGSSLSWMEGIQSLCQASKLHIV